MGRKDAALAGLPHKVPRAPHPLQALGYRLRRLQLHDQVDGTNVDAQFEGGSADQDRQFACLELALHLQAGFLRDTAVVNADRHSLSRRSRKALPGRHQSDTLDDAVLDQTRCPARSLRRHLFVQSVGGLLGQPAVVGKDEGGLVFPNQTQDPWIIEGQMEPPGRLRKSSTGVTT